MGKKILIEERRNSDRTIHPLGSLQKKLLELAKDGEWHTYPTHDNTKKSINRLVKKGLIKTNELNHFILLKPIRRL